jgi:hypothetical protein
MVCRLILAEKFFSVFTSFCDSASRLKTQGRVSTASRCTHTYATLSSNIYNRERRERRGEERRETKGERGEKRDER